MPAAGLAQPGAGVGQRPRAARRRGAPRGGPRARCLQCAVDGLVPSGGGCEAAAEAQWGPALALAAAGAPGGEWAPLAAALAASRPPGRLAPARAGAPGAAPAGGRPKVLFVGVQNAGLSQMAAGWLRHLGGDAVEVWSGGSAPGERLNPAAVEAMREAGVDISRQRPRRLAEGDVARADVVVTVGSGDACPVLPTTRHLDWAMEDPAGLGVDAVRRARDDIKSRVEGLLEELGVEGGAAGAGEVRGGAVGGAEETLGVRVALAMLRFYKAEISPLIPPSCRYVPTCSEYAMASYQKFGVGRGTLLTAWRLLRCAPWGGRGYDPPKWPPPGLDFLGPAE